MLICFILMYIMEQNVLYTFSLLTMFIPKIMWYGVKLVIINNAFLKLILLHQREL